MEKKKIIFLDFDGVLNGVSKAEILLWRIALLLHIKWLYRYIESILIKNKIIYKTFGIHDRKVKKLAKICHETGAVVVLTGSMRKYVWKWINKDERDKYNDRNNSELDKLIYLFSLYDIEVIGSVISDYFIYKKRQDEIYKWLADNEDIVEDYIILDDEWSHLEIFKNKTILTSNHKFGQKKIGYFYDSSGLKNKHVRLAIKMLGRKT